jgi:hypothetical protein
MTTPKVERDEVQTADSTAKCCGLGLQAGRALGLTLLGAAIIVPAVIYYLSKHLVTRGRTSLTRPRPHPRPEHATQRITIPVRAVTAPQSAQKPVEPKEPEADTAEVSERLQARFVASTESDKFHVPGCRWAQNINDEHMITFEDREAALTQGYVACNTCKP